MLVKNDLRIVALNTLYGSRWNTYLLLSENQQFNQSAWLEDILTQAMIADEKVIIIGHVSSGRSASPTYSEYGREFYRLVSRFSKIIVGQFFGYTHYDEFEIVKDRHDEPVGVEFMAPSLTPLTNHNPGFRVYEFNSEDWSLANYYQYYANLTKANEADRVKW